VTIVLAESPASYTVRAGDTVTVEVEEHPTTGYVWELEARPAEAVAVDAAPSDGGAEVPGSGGRRRWRVKVLRGPVVRLEAFLRRPWERAAPPAKSASAVLTVAE
jgi:predicted secreted protein